MRVKITPTTVKLWASARDTYDWANRPERRWPCSTLADSRVFAEFDSNGLLDLAIDGHSDADCDAHELSALCADLLAPKLPETHPAYFVAVAQHRAD